MASFELTNIDDQLYRALQMRAMQDNCSLSTEVETILREHLAKSPRNSGEANEAFMALVGSWQEDRTAEEIIADIRVSRQTGERFSEDSRVFD